MMALEGFGFKGERTNSICDGMAGWEVLSQRNTWRKPRVGCLNHSWEKEESEEGFLEKMRNK